MKKNSRREFLKNTTKVGAIAAVGGLMINSCSDNEVKQNEVVVGKSNKEEILYQGNTKYWKTYYLVAK
ncbi:hypothetical protein BKH42_00330 [Helicobacter sp. 13S00482-2]|uniref:twin-arginine translocation signal domain-containing protein n=1 Tax=Helicobacter sp. 13S00482-2 TaxID=1476200 RepID=UPI000BA65CE6|nr:twin-arginine translocation signal domain-containing protein [Helicobacter sp. 13S00482-2]PAF54400.1 hypothetical protein BKH42_00330 [Helicobacter sp. 13S00482-2]